MNNRITNSSQNNDILANAREFIQSLNILTTDKLFYISLNETPPKNQNIHFFTIDTTLVYVNFYMDFGPSNLANVVRFCEIVQDLLTVFFIIIIESSNKWKNSMFLFFNGK
jgi:hypothetical protein